MGKKLFSKVFMLGVIFLVLCMGLYMVNGLVQDRQQYRAKVVDGFAKGYAGRQAIGTPRLLMVCKESWREHSDNNIVNRERIFTMEAAADEAKLVTISTIEPRTRGIYQVNTFQSKNTLQASWKKPSFTRTRQPREALAVDVVEMSASNSLGSIQTVCGQTDLVVQIQDLRGVRDLAIQVNDQTYAAETGLIEMRNRVSLSG
jgi:inner membrane protein involved in colicin E2 resistance